MCRNENARKFSRMLTTLAATGLVFLAQGARSTQARQSSNPPPIKLCFKSLVGGDTENGTVTLSQPAPAGGLSVQVASSSKDAKIAPLTPASLKIPAGQTSIAFQIVTSPIKKPETVVVTACAPSPSPYPCPSIPGPGTLETRANLVLAPNGPASVLMKPAAVNAGSSSMGTVSLKYPAPKDVYYYTKSPEPPGAPTVYEKKLRRGGATITLTSTSSVTVPASINISQGGSSATFSATASQSAASTPQTSSCVMGPSPQTAAITATWELSASGSLQVNPTNQSASRYTSKTIRIDPSTIAGISHDGQVLVLNKSQCASMLTSGSVMFVKGLGVLDVGKLMKILKSSAAPQGGFAVGASSASLTDFINDGKMEIFFQNLGSVSEPGGPNGPFDEAAEPYSEPSPGETPWKYSTTGTANNYSFVAYKENNGLKGSVSAKGEVTNGSYDFLAVIHSDKLQEAKFTAATDGTLDVEWMAQTTASGQGIGESRLRMRPLFSGLADGPDGVPFLFQVYANLIFKPGFGEKAAAKGHFTITYKGEAGIDGSSPINEGLDVPPPDISSTTSSAMAAHGAVVAVNAPKFAISFGTESFLWAAGKRLPAALSMKAADFADSFESQLSAHLSQNVKYPDPKDFFELKRAAWVMWVSSVGYAGSGPLVMIPCQQYYLNFLAQAGMDKDMLGSISGSIPPDKGIDVFKKNGVIAIPSIKGCYPQK